MSRTSGLSDLVLILDHDNEGSQQTVRCLENKGYSTFAANSLDEALHKFIHMPFDVVVTESNIEDKPNIDILNSLKTIDHLVPVVFVSGDVDWQEGVLLMNNRAAGYYSKKDFTQKLEGILKQATIIHETEKRHLISDLREALVDYKRATVGLRSSDLSEVKSSLSRIVKHVYDRVFMHGVPRFTEDCANGVVSVIEENSRLSPEQEFFLIKRTHQHSDICAIDNDFKKYGQEFNLPKPMFIHQDKVNKNYYFITEMFPAAANAQILTLLNHQREYYEPLIKGIVEEILDIRSKWFDRTREETLDGVKEQVIHDYSINMLQAFGHISKYVKTEKHMELHGNDGIQDFITQMIEGLKETTIQTFGRVMDCSPSNSGLMTYRVNAITSDIEEAVGAETNGPRIMYDRRMLRKSLRFWDIPKKFGHVFEDYFHIADSYEANIDEGDKLRFLNMYLTKLYGDDKRLKSTLWSDFFIVGFYRNLRKMDLVMTKYAGNNELEEEHRKVPRNTYERRKTDYLLKINHYCHQATKHMVAYNQFIELEDIREKSWDTGMKKVKLFFSQFSEENQWERNPEMNEYSEKGMMAIRIATTLNDHYCGKTVNFEAIREDRLERIGVGADVIRPH